MKSLNLALAATAVCGLLASAAPTTVCENGLISIEGGAQRMVRCVPIQAFHQLAVKEDTEGANIIEPRGGKSLLAWEGRATAALLWKGKC